MERARRGALSKACAWRASGGLGAQGVCAWGEPGAVDATGSSAAERTRRVRPDPRECSVTCASGCDPIRPHPYIFICQIVSVVSIVRIVKIVLIGAKLPLRQGRQVHSSLIATCWPVASDTHSPSLSQPLFHSPSLTAPLSQPLFPSPSFPGLHLARKSLSASDAAFNDLSLIAGWI